MSPMTTYIDSGYPSRRLGGAITALVTPFIGDAVDRVALGNHIEWQIGNGIDGLVACGIAGEGAVLSMAERAQVIGACVDAAAGQVPVIVACGTNCTAGTIARVRQAAALDADAALVTLPYYSRPAPKGVVHHFERLADATDLPLIIHNLPSYTASDLAPGTLQALAAIPYVVAIADGTGDVGRTAAWRLQLPRHVSLFSTHDPTAAASALCGTHGAISAAANVAPRLFSALQHAAAAGNIPAVAALSAQLAPLFEALALESEPAVVKRALNLLRGVTQDVRLPLVGVEPSTDLVICKALRFLGSTCELDDTWMSQHIHKPLPLSL